MIESKLWAAMMRSSPALQLALRDGIDGTIDLIRVKRRPAARHIPGVQKLEHNEGIDEAPQQVPGDASECAVALALRNRIANHGHPVVRRRAAIAFR